MGITVLEVPGKSYPFHEHLNSLSDLISGHIQKPALRINNHGFRDNISNGHPRIQRGIGVLENHLHVLPGFKEVMLV